MKLIERIIWRLKGYKVMSMEDWYINLSPRVCVSKQFYDDLDKNIAKHIAIKRTKKGI